jgi:hypothetical protein
MKGGVAFGAMLIAAAVVGSVATFAVRGRPAASAPPSGPPPATATVVVTDLTTTAVTEGSLSYLSTNPVINHMVGTYTQLPRPGAIVEPGRTLYRVDDVPVVMMSGAVPAWRPFLLGMTDGPDISELQANLIVMGFAHGLLADPNGRFDLLTMYAVERWQLAAGYVPNGEIAIGQIVFASGSLFIESDQVWPGQPAEPGQVPFQATTPQRVVTVPVGPNLPTVRVGEPATIVLPDTTTTPGAITSIGPPPPTGGSSASGVGGDGTNGTGTSSDGSQTPAVSSMLTISLDEPAGRLINAPAQEAVQVALTTSSARHVLAAPITALLALAGGGYGVEVVDPSGLHHLVAVTTGTYTNTQVQVSGTGITAGTRVVVAQ